MENSFHVTASIQDNLDKPVYQNDKRSGETMEVAMLTTGPVRRANRTLFITTDIQTLSF